MVFRVVGKDRNIVIQDHKVKISMFIKYILNKDVNQKHMKKSNSKFLKDYETDMITALFHSYTRQIPSSSLMEIDRIYTEETGKTLKTNFSCSGCILRLMRQMAIVYFKDNLENLEEDLREKFKEKYKVE